MNRNLRSTENRQWEFHSVLNQEPIPKLLRTRIVPIDPTQSALIW